MEASYIDAVENDDEMLIWSRDMKGKLFKDRVPLDEFLYCYMKDNSGNPDMMDASGNPLKKMRFNTKRELRNFSETRDGLYESDIQPKYKAVLDLFSDAPKDAPVNVLFFDIETDFDLSDGRGYPKPDNPFGEVNSFQCFLKSEEEYFIFHTSKAEIKLKDDDYPVNIIDCSSERVLLRNVAKFLDEFDVDVFTGWYSNGYDVPYIMERSIMLFGERKAKQMYCRGNIPAKRRDFVDEHGNEQTKWTFIGRHHVDMMELYKKFNPGERKSFSLDSICEEDLGLNKVEYDGDLGELFRENPQKFFEYGIHDARLLMLLDKKHEIMRLATNLARESCVFIPDVTGSVKPIETGFLSFCHDKGIALPDKEDHNRESFQGAIVYDTIAGRHGYVMTVDLTALYPSAMIMLGLSTETVVGQLSDGYHDYIRVMTGSDEEVVFLTEDDKRHQLPAREMKELILSSGYTISAYGTIFNGELGLLSEYVQSRFDLRKHYQKMMKDYPKEADVYNLYQKVMKIVCNSLYGCISNAAFRLFDIRLARSITLTGQVISKWQAYESNRILNVLGGE